jgi:hypothetical protein
VLVLDMRAKVVIGRQLVRAVAAIADQNRAHAQQVRDGKIAGVVLEHGGAGGVEAIGARTAA